jgi:hypothetical protein
MLTIWDAGGYRAAIATHALLAAALIAMIAVGANAGTALDPREADDETPSKLAVVLAAAFAAFLTLPYLSFRPVTAALLLMAVAVWLIVRDRRLGEHSRAVWWLVPLTALLVNIHIYAILIPMWLGALWLGALWERRTDRTPNGRRKMWRSFKLLAACSLACLATPMLPGMVRTIWFYQFGDSMVAGPVVAEYQPFYRGTFGAVAGGMALVAMACIARRASRIRVGDLLWLAFGVVLLFRMGRFAPVFAMIAAPMFAAALPRFSDGLFRKPAVAGALALVLLVGVVRIASAFPGSSTSMDAWMNRHGPEAPGYPSSAAQYVADNVSPRTGRLINEYSWGGYLSWRLGDRYQVLLDGRTNLYSADFWRSTYLAASAERTAFLRSVEADAAVLPVGASLFRDGLRELGWTSAYRDDRAEVLTPPGRAVAATE